MSSATYFLLVLALLQLLVGPALCRGPPEVAVAAGRLSGAWRQTRDGRDIAAFEGVPYARPPVGELRFQPPRPAEPWSGVRTADKPSAVCTQRNVFFRSVAVEGSEDCLYLNVYAPESVSRTTPLPVMVFIHGGGFVAGSGDIYGPEYLLDHDVVLVTFNYRLGPLGFFTTGDGVVGANNGMKDQVLALRWVRDNVRAFGGDPGMVTIFGESAGGASVDLQTLSPMSKGLFHRAISMSGTSLAPWAMHSPAQVRAVARKTAQLLKCPSQPSEELKKCLMAKSAEELVATDTGFMQWLTYPLVPFKVAVEPAGPDAFLDLTPEQVYAEGRAHDIPYMTGFVSHEGCIAAAPIADSPANMKELDERFAELAPIILMTDDYPEEVNNKRYEKLRRFYFGDGVINKASVFQLIDLFSDAIFVESALRTVKLRAAQSDIKSPVFLYKMEYLSNNRSFSKLFGTSPNAEYGMCHGDDLLYLFPLSAIPPQPSRQDEAFSRKVLGLFVHFATTGRPTADGSWQEVEHPDGAEYLHLTGDSGLNLRTDFAPERMALWADLPAPRGRDEL